MPNPFVSLPEEERLQEIAKILAIGAIRYVRRQGPLAEPEAVPPDQTTRAIWDLVDDVTEKRILRFLHQRVEAGPELLRTALLLSPMTLTRRLARLRKAGLIQVSGKTRNISYSLAPIEGRN